MNAPTICDDEKTFSLILFLNVRVGRGARTDAGV